MEGNYYLDIPLFFDYIYAASMRHPYSIILIHLTLDFSSPPQSNTLNITSYPLIFLKLTNVKTIYLFPPDTLTTLHVGGEYLSESLPPLLEDLNANCSFREFPSTLLKLELTNLHPPVDCLPLSPSFLVEFTLVFLLLSKR